MNKFKNYANKEEQLAAVWQNGNNIRYIKNPDREVQVAAVKQYEYFIEYIKNPHKDVQLIAVKKNGYTIQFIDNPDKEIQLAAVKNNEYSIRFINNPDKNVILISFKKDIKLFKYVEYMSLDTQKYLIKNMPELLLEYPDKFDKSLKKKYKYLLVPGKLGIFDE